MEVQNMWYVYLRKIDIHDLSNEINVSLATVKSWKRGSVPIHDNWINLREYMKARLSEEDFAQFIKSYADCVVYN